ncbi:MAG: hypothetical protein WBC91_10180 [Phototrophicaceae bacterium]
MVAIDKGFFIRQLEKTAPNLDSLTDTIFEMGLKNIVIKILDDTEIFPDPDYIHGDIFGEWVAFMQSKQIPIWAWVDIYSANLQAQVHALHQRMRDTGISTIVLRPMGQWSARDARVYVNLLKDVLPKDGILAIANPPYERDFPLVEFASVCHAIMPLIPLDTLSGNLRANITAIQSAYTQYFPDKILIPAALTAGQTQGHHFVWRARPDQIDEFLTICTELTIPTVNFMAWQDVRYQPRLWTTIQTWDYQAPPPQAAPIITVASAAPAQATSQIASNLSAEEQLHQYGVALGSDKGGMWQADEIQNVLDVVQNIAESLAPLFDGLYNDADVVNAFRMLYAPLLVKRNPTNNVNPNTGQGVWYGRNQAGFVMYYGNKMFIKGSESLRTGDGLGFNSHQIIAHEFAHTINFRYPKIASLQGGDLDQYYGKYLQLGSHTLSSGEVVRLAHVNDGYSFAARSSIHFYETVTDAIANYTYDGLTMTDRYTATQKLKGIARFEQLSTLLTHVIEHRVKSYDNLDGMVAKIQSQFDNAVLKELSPALQALTSSGFNARLAQY